VANLLALRQWYRHVRRDFFVKEKQGDVLCRGAFDILDGAIVERLKQLNLFARNLEISVKAEAKFLKKGHADKALHSQKKFMHDWPRMKEYFSGNNEEKAELKKRDSFVKIMQGLASKGNSYLEAIQSLTPAQAQKGTGWLKDITDGIIAGCTGNLHASRQKEKSRV
jgi:argonaute-like protein implicated in RNA metabolism and viral defense